MAYRARLKTGNYTDSDIKAFYIDKRYDFGPFIREVGDFVAHPKRDKGNTFDAAIGIYSQIAFFQRYLGTDKKTIAYIGDCDWWMKPYFVRKMNTYPPRDIKTNLKMSKAELRKVINSWFPGEERFPKRIEATNPFQFYDVVNYFSQILGAPCAFQAGRVKSELRAAFKAMGISSVITEDFLIGTATILNGMEVDMAEGVTASITIHVGKRRHIKVPGGDPKLLASGGYLSILLPDGPLEIKFGTKTPKEQKLVDIGATLLDTEIDTEPYFDRSLVHYPHPQLPELNLKKDLQFVANATPQVTAC